MLLAMGVILQTAWDTCICLFASIHNLWWNNRSSYLYCVWSWIELMPLQLNQDMVASQDLVASILYLIRASMLFWYICKHICCCSVVFIYLWQPAIVLYFKVCVFHISTSQASKPNKDMPSNDINWSVLVSLWAVSAAAYVWKTILDIIMV